MRVVTLLVASIAAVYAYDRILALRDLQEKEDYVERVRFVRLREKPPHLDRWKTPRKEIEQGWVGVVDKRYRIRADADGFLMPSAVHADPDFTIVFLGGSTTACGLMDEEERFPYAVGRILEGDLGINVNSYNGGMGGNNSMHSLVNLVVKVLPLEPDVVVMMHNMNDLSALMILGSYWNSNFSKSLILEGHNLFYWEKGPELSGFPGLAHRLFPHVTLQLAGRATRGDRRDEWEKERGKTPMSYGQASESAFRASLLRFVAIVRASGAVPVLMTQANRFLPEPDPDVGKSFQQVEEDWRVSYAQYKKHYDRFNDVTRSVAAEEDVLLVDLAAVIPQSSDFMYDSVHLNPNGSLQAADEIAAQIRPLAAR